MATSQLDPMLDIVKVNKANKSPIHFQEVLRSIVFSHYAAHGNLTQQKRDDNHASLNLLVARDKGLTSEGINNTVRNLHRESFEAASFRWVDGHSELIE